MVESVFVSPLKFHEKLTFITDPANNPYLWAPDKSSKPKSVILQRSSISSIVLDFQPCRIDFCLNFFTAFKNTLLWTRSETYVFRCHFPCSDTDNGKVKI